ncbi:MAG: YqeG family HAD IIIA-type phosphatase [Trueperaceae bacterium]
MLMPDVVVPAAQDVTPELLNLYGVKAVMVDLDDTILASSETQLGESVRHWLASLHDAGMPVAMLSNGARDRVERSCQELGIDGHHLAGKPFWWAFQRGLKRLGYKAGETAMIGDQIFTDVLGANLAGMVSVLVRPLSPGRLPHTRAARYLERWILQGGGHGRPVDR